jgi:hypothetical protein
MKQENKNLMIGVARNVIKRLVKKGRTNEQIETFVKSKRGQKYMADLSTFVNQQISI